MSGHTKEPWSACEAGGHIYINEAGGAGYVCNLVVHPHRSDEVRANARRIVACVNFCRGVPDSELKYLEPSFENMAVVHWSFPIRLENAARQRDELMAEVERTIAQWHEYTPGTHYSRLCEAIARAKGELVTESEGGEA